MKKTNKVLDSFSQFLLPFSLFIGLGVTKIINTSQGDVWISIIIGSLLGLFINHLLISLPDKDNKFTYYFCNCALLLLSLMTMIKLISSVYLDRTGNVIIMIPFALLLVYSSFKKRYDLLKVISILGFIYIIIDLFAFSSLISTTNIDYFKPVFINPASKILLGALEYALYSTIPLITIPDLKNHYDYKIYLLSSFFILVIFVLIVGNLGLELSSSYRYPEYMIFKNIAILDFIENIENILFFIWIINIYTISSYTILNIKDIVQEKWTIITIFSIALIICLVLIDNYKTPIMIFKYLDYIILFIYVLFFIGNKKIIH